MSKTPRMLKDIVGKGEYSIQGIARAVGVDHASLLRSLRDNGNPESRTIEKILNYIEYDLKINKRREVKPKANTRERGWPNEINIV